MLFFGCRCFLKREKEFLNITPIMHTKVETNKGQNIFQKEQAG